MTAQDQDPILKVQRVLLHYRNNWDAAVRDIFHAAPSEDQVKVLKAIQKPGARVAVKAGKGVGKTALAAWVIMLRTMLYDRSKVAATAPSEPVLRDGLWPEARMWREKVDNPLFRDHLGLTITKERIFLTRLPERNFVAMRTARPERPETMQGIHDRNTMFVGDEASGITADICEKTLSGLTDFDSRALLISNPTRSDGYFYDIFNKRAKNKIWEVFTLSALNCAFVNPRNIQEIAEKYGTDSQQYAVYVLGEFPSASADVVIPIGWIVDAIERDIKPEGIKKAGLDVALFGDDANALCIRQGPRLTYCETWSGMDTMQTVGRVQNVWKQGLFDQIAVDANMLGAGVAHRLIELGVPTICVNVSESSAYDRKYKSLRDELWFKGRGWFESKVCSIDPQLNNLEQLKAELSTVRYGFAEGDGRWQVWSKKRMKHELHLDSPNLADAFNNTFAEGGLQNKRVGTDYVVTETEYPWI